MVGWNVAPFLLTLFYMLAHILPPFSSTLFITCQYLPFFFYFV